MGILKSVENSIKLDATPANESQFFIEVGGVPTDALSVLDFDSFEHAISSDYRFDISLVSDAVFDPAQLIGKKAKLKIIWDVQPVYLHGYVSAFTNKRKSADGEESILTLSSPLYAMKQNVNCRVYVNKDVAAIIEEVLQGAGMVSSDYEIKLSAKYSKKEFTVQYNESDYEFLMRIMSHYGIFTTFLQDENACKLMVYDSADSLPKIDGMAELVYQEQTGETRSVESMFSLRQQAKFATAKYQLKDYNYRTPEAGLETTSSGSKHITSAGVAYHFGENFKSLDEGEYISTIRQQALDWQKQTFVAETDCKGLLPGYKFTLSGHDDSALNGDYLVIEVEHHADQRAAFAFGDKQAKMTYRNRVLLLRAGTPYRKPADKKWYFHGVFTAKVETTGGEYAYLDEQGRYRIRMPFDLSDTKEGEASHPVRLMQPYTGDSYGMHFPLHAGTEVLVTCVNGDLDRPIILGAVSNPDTPSPVTSSNYSENIMRTWGGNELLMDDRKGAERVELFTRDKKNIVSLDANSEGHKIRVATEEGEMEAYASKNMLLESGDSQIVQSGNDHIVTIENSQKLMTKNKGIEQKSARDIKMKAGENIKMLAENKNIEMDVGNDMVVDVQKNMSVEVQNNNMEINVTSGNLEIQTAKAITLKGNGGGVIHIGQGQGSLEITSSGDLNLKGASVTITGNSINIIGQNVGNN